MSASRKKQHVVPKLIVRRIMTAIAIGISFGLYLVPSAAISGCSSNDPFVKLHCVIDDTPRVSSTRVVTLGTIDYIYTFKGESFYSENFRATISDAYAIVNRIFKEDRINLQIAPIGTFDEHNKNLVVWTAPDIFDMLQIHQGRGHFIAVHWSEWDAYIGNVENGFYVGPSCPDQRCNWINIYGEIRNPDSILRLGKRLAETFGIYFGLSINTNSSNLMCDLPQCSGTDLTIGQANTMWAAINNGRPALESETCDLPVMIGPRRLKI